MDLVFSRTKKIPSKSFGRECSLCSSRHGVPIECSARGCKTSYHTTCAIRGKLKMQAIFGKTFKGGIKLRSYCKQHTPPERPENGSPSQGDKIDSSGVKEIDMTNLADDGLQEGNEELDYFWKYVDINEVHKKISEAYARSANIKSDCESTSPKKNKKLISPTKTEPTTNNKKNNLSGSPKKVKIKKEDVDVKQESPSPHPQPRYSLSPVTSSSPHQEIDPLVLDLIYRYWMLLRTANNGQSLIKFSPSALKEREFEQRKSIMKLRIELERVRNLSYMIGKREKLKSSWLKAHQNIIKRTFSVINDLSPISDVQTMIESPGSSDNYTQSNHNHHNHHNHNHHQANSNQNNHNHHNHHHNHYHNNPSGTTNLMSNGKKSLHQTQHVQHHQPTNGMFDESDQLINDLITCDQIYELPNSSTNSNYSNLSYQDRSTLERRRTLSLVRRINRQLKAIRVEPSLNPYAKSYLALKRSDSPLGGSHHHQHQHHQSPNAKGVIKYR